MIAIVIPVLGRAKLAAPLAASIRSSTTVAHRVLFLCSPSDDQAIRAYRQAGQALVVEWEPERGDFAMKCNRGFSETDEPFIFCGATDLTFTPGWDIEALRVAEETGAGVIGTNDCANPAVKKGRHSTHSLVRRSYAEDSGCTVDSTGAIYSEEYWHEAVDNELCELAMARGQWAFAADSRVIHNHPYYDRRTRMDATYRRGFSHRREDRVLFMHRRRLWQRELREREARAAR